ncbi:Outer membrane protein slp [Pseudidiomarina piscicola]|uniref:Outer membrane protein slp n=1 Tax=Pseudidiomarina piscicola TaxID=2614830 RepID=A0A6Z0BWV1_9GAMM|nr:Slp family lipoprotein [Pseudidiomarina piscicola]CAB0149695.1 Outer membrane protein slp [Pseudidiomarina piscicola]VZT39144.1 Outer membrane protein slp [Pseudomonas aeruginosa]
MMKYWLVALGALTLSACSTVPDELTVAEGTQLTPYTVALEQPEQAQGKQARWGGVIAEVRNTDNGTTIEVVNYDLNSYGRPAVSDSSDGRFRAQIDGFVDPMVYKKGRSITFTGIIQAPEEGKIDEFRYLFPNLAVNGKYLWKKIDNKPMEVDYSSLWYRHHWYSPPYRVYYPVPARSPSPKQGEKKNN